MAAVVADPRRDRARRARRAALHAAAEEHLVPEGRRRQGRLRRREDAHQVRPQAQPRRRRPRSTPRSPPGTVIKQDPPPGKKVEKDDRRLDRHRHRQRQDQGARHHRQEPHRGGEGAARREAHARPGQPAAAQPRSSSSRRRSRRPARPSRRASPSTSSSSSAKKAGDAKKDAARRTRRSRRRRQRRRRRQAEAASDITIPAVDGANATDYAAKLGDVKLAPEKVPRSTPPRRARCSRPTRRAAPEGRGGRHGEDVRVGRLPGDRLRRREGHPAAQRRHRRSRSSRSPRATASSATRRSRRLRPAWPTRPTGRCSWPTSPSRTRRRRPGDGEGRLLQGPAVRPDARDQPARRCCASTTTVAAAVPRGDHQGHAGAEVPAQAARRDHARSQDQLVPRRQADAGVRLRRARRAQDRHGPLPLEEAVLARAVGLEDQRVRDRRDQPRQGVLDAAFSA